MASNQSSVSGIGKTILIVWFLWALWIIPIGGWAAAFFFGMLVVFCLRDGDPGLAFLFCLPAGLMIISSVLVFSLTGSLPIFHWANLFGLSAVLALVAFVGGFVVLLARPSLLMDKQSCPAESSRGR